MSTRQGGTRAPRSDARRNREALMCAARAAFAVNGLDTPLEQVARDAGLSIGTLYRHFPTRLDLVEEIFIEKLHTLLRAAEGAVAADDAWAGFRTYMETMCELQSGDRGFNDLSSIRLPTSACIDAAQTRIAHLEARIVRRAQKEGRLRCDITPEDLAFITWSHARISEATKGVAPQCWRRYLALMLDALEAERASPLPEPPLTRTQLELAMVQLGVGACGMQSRLASPAPDGDTPEP